MSNSNQRTAGSSAAIGAILWIVAILQYAITQLVVASAWKTPYSLRDNYISDLGNTACGQFTLPHGTPGYVCSPLHALMNSSFILAGALMLIGAILLHRTWPRRALSTTATVLLLLAALGKILVGLVPENSNVSLHLLGAFNLPLSSIGILLLSIAVMRTNRRLGVFGIVVAAVGLIGTVLSVAAQYRPSLYLGLGVGGSERLIGYPGNAWMVVVGIVVLVAASTARRRSQQRLSLAERADAAG
jgi:hypothetical membrane protein